MGTHCNVRAQVERLIDRELARFKAELMNLLDELFCEGESKQPRREGAAVEIERPAEGPRELVSSVKQVFKSHPFASWSVVTLERKLKKEGFIFAAKNPRSSLNTVLTRLAEGDQP